MSVVAQFKEVRCPQGARALLAKVKAEGGVAQRTPENLLEIMCRTCTRNARREMEQVGMATDFRILHRFDFGGEFVESVREAFGPQ